MVVMRETTRFIEKDMYIDSWAWECEECEAVYMMIEGTPKEHGYKYCPSCGRRITQHIKAQEGEEA